MQGKMTDKRLDMRTSEKADKKVFAFQFTGAWEQGKRSVASGSVSVLRDRDKFTGKWTLKLLRTESEKAAIEQISKRMNEIKMPAVSFKNATLIEVADYLTKKSKERDPSGGGIRVEVDDSVVEISKRGEAHTFSLQLPEGTSMTDILRYTSLLAGTAKYLVEPDKVVLTFKCNADVEEQD